MVSGKKARPITQPNFKAYMYLLYTSTVHVTTTDGSTVQKRCKAQKVRCTIANATTFLGLTGMAVAAAAYQRRAADLLIKLSCHKPKWLLSGWK